MCAAFTHDWLSRKPYREFHPRLRAALERLTAWPEPERYDELVQLVPHAPDVSIPRFVTQSPQASSEAGGYEQHVATRRAVPTRPEDWHDFWNMIVWAHFPKLRWALNAIHVDPETGPIDPRNRRTPAQNLATTFDESGMLVVSTSKRVLEELRALRFKVAFWDYRDEQLASTRFYFVGHGMLESLLVPRAGLTARSLLLHVPELPELEASDAQRFELDAFVANRIDSWRTSRPILDPIPVLAIPGFSDNAAAEFYDDPRNIRFVPISRRPHAEIESLAAAPLRT